MTCDGDASRGRAHAETPATRRLRPARLISRSYRAYTHQQTMDFLNKINDWFETFRHAEGSLDFLWTFKVPKYAIIVDAKAGC